MKRLFLFFSILCLFFIGVNGTHAATTTATGDKCQRFVLDSTHATQTCPVEFTVTGGSSKTFRVTMKISLVAMNNPTYNVNITDSKWRLVKQEGNTFIFETTLTSLPEGTYQVGNIVATGTTNDTQNCGGTYTMGFTPRCSSTKVNETTTIYYDNNGEVTDQIAYLKQCFTHDCDVIDVANPPIYYNHEGQEITREQYAIYCKYNQSCGAPTDPVTNKKVYFNLLGVQTDFFAYIAQCNPKNCGFARDSNTNTTYFFNSSGAQVDFLNFISQCKNPSCNQYTDPNNNTTYYYNSSGVKVIEAAFHEDCDEKPPSCGEKDGKYYDQNKNEVNRITYLRQCETHQCEILEDEEHNTTYYYDKTGQEVNEKTYKIQCTDEYHCKVEDNKYYGKTGEVITKDEYNTQCVEHVCDTYKDEDNKIHYYNNDGAEVSELEQIKSCKPIICTTYKIGEVTHYFDNKEKEVTKAEYESACLAKPICKEEKGKYYDSEGKEVNKKDYEKSCKKYACQEVDGKYYDSIGAIVSKAIYEVSCNKKDTVENPNTGASIPLRILAFILILGISIYSFAVKHNKIMRVK